MKTQTVNCLIKCEQIRYTPEDWNTILLQQYASTKMSTDVTIVERAIHSPGGWSLQTIYIHEDTQINSNTCQ